MKNLVTVGGGTGSYIVLSGIKNIPDVSISAIVSMADDGGSTGVLRRKYKVMPPGDARQCLVALSGKEFLNHRFTKGIFKKHAFGNLLLVLFEKISGNFSRGLKFLSWIFNTRGKIIPITKDNAELGILFESSKKVWGESNIDTANFPEKGKVQDIFYKNGVKINRDATRAVLEADYIIIGPGNIYCSILPNFVVNGFKEAVKKSKAKTIFIMNLVNKQGHTMNWDIADYIREVEKYFGKSFDVILINEEEFSQAQKERYLKDGGEGIFIKNGYNNPKIVKAPLLSNRAFVQNNIDTVKRSLIRHDSKKLADCINKIINYNK